MNVLGRSVAIIDTLYALLFGAPDLYVPPRADNWTITIPWTKNGPDYRFESVSSSLIAQCRDHPSHYIKFPMLLGSFQQIYLDETLIYAQGNRSAGTIDGQYSSPALYCEYLTTGSVLKWNVYIDSAYFGRINFFLLSAK